MTKHINEAQVEIEKNIQYLNNQVIKNSQTINSLITKTALLEQSTLFQILLNQYAYETQNIVSIINSAIHGKIHTTVLPPNMLLSQLREIQLELPAGNQLPLEINIQNIPELLSISSTSIIYRDNFLIFILQCPIVKIDEYNLYHTIPLPFYFENNNVVLVKPDNDYIAISDDSEFYLTFSQSQIETCIPLNSYTLCKGNHPVYRKSSSKLCEILLLENPQDLPQSCKIIYVSFNNSIWNRLSNTNSWIYCTRDELVTLNCKSPQRTFSVYIKNIGRLTISPTCTVHTTSLILTPISTVLYNHSNDIVPLNPMFNLINTYTESIIKVTPQQITNTDLFNDLCKLVKHTTNWYTNPNSNHFLLSHYHIVIIYTCLSICIISIIIVAVFFKCKKKVIQVYTTEINNTQL
ncbi:uncharacterized protein LOC126905045 [Daktulosphaira vitifoliae]|uniref:uncharacterized protein LOC126905045 n=1 Tax=Daktulosphaira vitifoliae TaxID=58002 RepID=UPI0021A9D80B|nr:uncharacterized protein LOC126905045 [Daktulosphaira vitifoliae]